MEAEHFPSVPPSFFRPGPGGAGGNVTDTSPLPDAVTGEAAEAGPAGPARRIHLPKHISANNRVGPGVPQQSTWQG